MSSSSSRPTSHRDTVQLPSGTKLEYTLIRPSPDEDEPTKLAICLHPWSWLGGRMNDPVLRLLTPLLLEHGYDILRYNSRGVGNSTGWPSLTGLREADDLAQLVAWARSSRPALSSLVLLGYSHGALIASLHPALPTPGLRTAHLLLSYPLGPRPWLTAFHSAHYTAALRALVRDPRARVLVVHGAADNFTSAASYDAWAASLRADASTSVPAPPEAVSAPPGDTLRIVKVDTASHFWAEEGVVELLEDAVREWLPLAQAQDPTPLRS